MNKGILYAAGAFIFWGLLPFYWKSLQDVPAMEILGHRMVWSLLVVLGLLAYRRHWRWVKAAVRDRRTLLTFLATATLLAVNWFTYIWGVNNGYIVETSLGYFINPLVTVLLGLLLLNEKMRPWQWAAILSATAGVVYLTVGYGALPWISLTLAFSFALYGLLRKTARLGALEGLSLETALLFLPALAYLLFLESQGTGSLGHAGAKTAILLAGAGVVTAIPLLWFSEGARRIPLTTVGILQYIAPTMQLMIGVFIYREPFPREELVGFSLIWTALLIYWLEGVYYRRQQAHRQTVKVDGA